jgi:hypothetical protein
LGLKILRVLFLACDTLCPYIIPFEQLKQRSAIDKFP